jgi:hypothetical protein
MAREGAIATLPEYRWTSRSIHSPGALAQASGVPRAFLRSPSVCKRLAA